jgi:putative endonuclease
MGLVVGLVRRPDCITIRMSYFVYILACRSKDRTLTYVGWTLDLDRRLAQHNAGKGARSTRGRVWTLLYAERHDTRSAAMSREVHLKRDRAFRALLKNI